MFPNIAKFLYSLRNKPYLSVRIKYRPDGSLGISSVYNQQFIMDLDQNYAQANNPDYNPTLNDNVKLAYYLADGFDSILGRFEQSLMRDRLRDDEDEEDALSGVPALQNTPIRDVIDIGKMRPATGRID